MKPIALDLFCGGGLVARGLIQAGFQVFGVDLKRSKAYPGIMIEADVLSLTPEFIRQFQFAWASPPCQRWTAMRGAKNAKGDAHPDLITPTRALLKKAGRPYVIENVEGAKAQLQNPICLCGTAFGLQAQGAELRRHRLLECSLVLDGPPACRHSDGPVIGIYGGHARIRSAKHGGRGTRDVWEGGHRAAALEAMGVSEPESLLTLSELSEGIPPAYAKWIGERVAAALT